MRKHIGPLVATCGWALCPTGGALAQEEAAQAQLEEVIVTAEKVESTVQRTPAAVIVQSGEDLVDRNITDLTTLGKAVPSLSVGPPIVGASIVFLRGVGQYTTSVNTQPGVAFVFDGVYAPREMTLTSFFDLDSIQVLPGPQGTLYGRNAAGGIINVTTNQPSDRLEGSVLVEGGNYGTMHATGVLNVPVNETLALRGAVDYNKHDGYMSNGLNDMDSTAGRLSMRYEPNDVFSLNVSANAYEISGKGPAVSVRMASPLSAYTPKPSDPWFDPFPTDGLFTEQRGQSVSAAASYDFGDVQLTYLPGYVSFDGDGLSQNGSMPLRVLLDGEFTSHELRLTSDTDGRAQWLAGLYAYQGDTSQIGFIGVPGVLFGQPGTVFTGGVTSFNEQDSYAVFGQYTYSITDTVRLTAGGRYSKDEIVGEGEQTLTAPNGTVLALIPYGAPVEENHTDWKLGIEVDVADSSLFYAHVQTGYLQGGYSQVLAGIGLALTFKPEELVAFTVGTKNRFLGNRLQVNAEAFYYDYKNYQVVYVQSPFNVNFNVPKTEILGSQLDIDYLLTPSTKVFLSATWLHAEYKEFISPTPPFRDLAGYEQQQSPSLSGSIGLQQQWSLGPNGTITGRIQSYYNSGYWSTYDHSPGTQQDSYTKTDLTLTYTTSDEKWSVGAFVNNLEDEAVYATSAPNQLGEVISTVAPPRTYGARLTARF